MLLRNTVPLLLLVVFFAAVSCGDAPREARDDADATAPPAAAAADTAAAAAECVLVEDGFGPAGTIGIEVEVVASGLEVPWGIAFLPDGGMLVTERSGTIQMIRDGEVLYEPVASVEASASGEGGLLGIAAHPDFSTNRHFFVYYTTSDGNRVERWRLSEDGSSATADRVILEGIPSARFHNGGRLRFGPDGMLYIGTGDAGDPSTSQDRNSLAGKLLRVTADGDVPGDNPFPGSPVYVTGIRNTQGFDWPNDRTVWLTDHGPSGERGRQGHDEVNVAEAGSNLGWPDIYGCESAEEMSEPVLTWQSAVPPGGAAIYRGDGISEWQGDLIVGTLGSRHLHHVDIEGGAVGHHAVYLEGDEPDGHGRLREVVMGPDGLYVTTSNCDGRGTCPSDGDKILRIR